MTGVAVIGGLFFGALGSHPGRAAYATAAELAAWIALAVIIVMAALVGPLARASASTSVTGPAMATKPASTDAPANEPDHPTAAATTTD